MIIGSGAAGIAAVESIRSQDKTGEIILLSEERDGYYSRPGLAYYLTGELNEPQLFPYDERDFQNLRTRRCHARVVRLEPVDHRIELHDGQYLRYDRLLIATGASAARMEVPGIGLKGVVKLDNLGDARRILSLTRGRPTAVVIGGGITALELVEGLVARGVKTHYFLRRDRYWHNLLDETEAQIVERRLVEHGVQIHYRTELAEILGKKGQVRGVRTKYNELIKCQLVGIAIGIRPRKELALSSDSLEVDRGILVDEFLHTSAKDVFAAGDVAQVHDPFTGKSVLDSLWGPAREQGTIAGLNMVGEQNVYSKPVAFNVTRLAGLTTTIIGTVGKGGEDDLVGIARGDSETWRQLPDAIAAQEDFEINRLRLMVGKQRILGAILIGDQTLSRPIHALIEQRIDITPIRKRLLQESAPIADLIAEFWRQLKLGHVPQHA